jgi:hypothetical protein
MRRWALKRRSAMAGGSYGGDDSVKWYLDVDNVRSSSVSSNGTKQHYEGVDDTPETGDVPTFTIIITLKDEKARERFRHQLRIAGASASNSPVKLTIPIEDKSHGGPNEKQIQVYWP